MIEEAHKDGATSSVEPLQTELGRLEEEKRMVTGIRGQARAFSNELTRSRQTVRKAINRVVKLLRSSEIPQLADHLLLHIPAAVEGNFAYTSDHDWQID